MILTTEVLLKNKIHSRWQSRIKDLSEELDASKLSMTIMIEENAKLRLALNRTAEEGERALEEASGLAAIKVQHLERQLAEIMASRETKSDSAGGADCEKLTQEAQRLRQRLRLAEDAAEDQGDRCRRLNAALARAGADAATRESELSARLAAVEAELTEVRQQRVKLAEDARREREKALYYSYGSSTNNFSLARCVWNCFIKRTGEESKDGKLLTEREGRIA
jgi:hypothetical protein